MTLTSCRPWWLTKMNEGYLVAFLISQLAIVVYVLCIVY
jgi:hypothetical protein